MNQDKHFLLDPLDNINLSDEHLKIRASISMFENSFEEGFTIGTTKKSRNILTLVANNVDEAVAPFLQRYIYRFGTDRLSKLISENKENIICQIDNLSREINDNLQSDKWIAFDLRELITFCLSKKKSPKTRSEPKKYVYCRLCHRLTLFAQDVIPLIKGQTKSIEINKTNQSFKFIVRVSPDKETEMIKNGSSDRSRRFCENHDRVTNENGYGAGIKATNDFDSAAIQVAKYYTEKFGFKPDEYDRRLIASVVLHPKIEKEKRIELIGLLLKNTINRLGLIKHLLSHLEIDNMLDDQNITQISIKKSETENAILLTYSQSDRRINIDKNINSTGITRRLISELIDINEKYFCESDVIFTELGLKIFASCPSDFKNYGYETVDLFITNRNMYTNLPDKKYLKERLFARGRASRN